MWYEFGSIQDIWATSFDPSFLPAWPLHGKVCDKDSQEGRGYFLSRAWPLSIPTASLSSHALSIGWSHMVVLGWLLASSQDRSVESALPFLTRHPYSPGDFHARSTIRTRVIFTTPWRIKMRKSKENKAYFQVNHALGTLSHSSNHHIKQPVCCQHYCHGLP